MNGRVGKCSMIRWIALILCSSLEVGSTSPESPQSRRRRGPSGIFWSDRNSASRSCRFQGLLET
jgi:hypothetical protein